MKKNSDQPECRGAEEERELRAREKLSPYCDLIYYRSTVNPELVLAMRVSKPEKPGYILVGTHGWHMTIPEWRAAEKPETEYLLIDVDMRGRPYSDGRPDANGWELYDVIDAVETVKKRYAPFIRDPETVFYESCSGGGGNGLALAAKFPDYFAQITAQAGISDYALWYRNDRAGVYRDEMDVWIGDPADEERYASRSGITGVGNLCAPLALVHGELDTMVPSEHSRNYVRAAEKAGKSGLVRYLELPGVGLGCHWNDITAEQSAAFRDFCESERRKHTSPVRIPRQGRFTVCGYLFTKEFSLVLNDVGRIAQVEYDLTRGEFTVTGVPEGEYTLTVHEK